jgi:hypothetical protein
MEKEKNEGNSTDEIEITPEMIEAGLLAFARSDSRFDTNCEMIVDIFVSMIQARG